MKGESGGAQGPRGIPWIQLGCPVRVPEPARTALDEIADELHARPSNEFTAARNATARAAQDAGDAGLANALRRMRKPTSAAWLAN